MSTSMKNNNFCPRNLFHYLTNHRFRLFIIPLTIMFKLDGCEDSSWVKYGDTKCFKLLAQFLTWEQARIKCQSIHGQSPSKMATISNELEQEFIEHYLFNTSSAVNNVWIGASRSSVQNSSDFIWIDGKKVEGYTNWQVGSPTQTQGRNCLQMKSGWSKVAGFWEDVHCATGNWAICESFQIWNAHETQLAIIALRNNPVPVGFVYVQLPGEPEPKAMWPQVQWADVTSNYAGLFFRAEGSGSAPFGTPQDDNTRQMTRIEWQRFVVDDALPPAIDLPKTGWSDWMRSSIDDTGNNGHYWHHSHRYHYSNEEVRPKNTAVKIWRRSG